MKVVTLAVAMIVGALSGAIFGWAYLGVRIARALGADR